MNALPFQPDPVAANALIVVAKRPTPGQTKTRLSPPLSLEQASGLYECFLQDTLDLVRQVPDVRPVIAYLPESERDYFARLAPDFELILQEGQNLGERLDHALTHYLQLGYRKAVIMDSDSPTLPVSCLVSAFAMLGDGSDAVIGPCDDGGYYLIGLKHPQPRLLLEVRMSTPNVTADTLALAAEENLKVGLLPTWYDVDNHLSLRRVHAELAGASGPVARYTRQALQQASMRKLLAATDSYSVAPLPGQEAPTIQ